LVALEAVLADLWQADQVILEAGALVLPAAAVSSAPASLEPNLAQLRAATRGETIAPHLAVTGQAGDVVGFFVQEIVEAD
jgi:hypothetical protein